MAKIMVVDDEASILSVVSTLLRKEGHEVMPVLGGEKAEEELLTSPFDLMISDIHMTPITGIDLLKFVKRERSHMAVIVLTGDSSVTTAVEAMKEGAFDYVTKPFKPDELAITVQRALEYSAAINQNLQLNQENQQLKAAFTKRFRFDNIIAESPSMRKVCEMIERVAPTDTTVLILGDSGTGKELVAKAIHTHSARKGKRFVPINCAALPETLLESELFGHVKGAFTGAATNKKGLFEVADEGTIFLDEVNSMPLSLQGKLLRVLQEREIRKVGGTEDTAVNVRVLAASNNSLEDMIAKDEFREDLFYRLSVIPIEIGPLRERREDILPLVDFFLRDSVGPEGQMPEIESDAQMALESYAWPGNVRELENAIRHACTFASNNRIKKDDLPAKILKAPNLDEVIDFGSNDAPEDFMGKSLKAFLRAKEKEYLSRVITHMSGDKEKAAKALKISLATLYRKLPDAID